MDEDTARRIAREHGYTLKVVRHKRRDWLVLRGEDETLILYLTCKLEDLPENTLRSLFPKPHQ